MGACICVCVKCFKRALKFVLVLVDCSLLAFLEFKVMFTSDLASEILIPTDRTTDRRLCHPGRKILSIYASDFR